MAREKRTIRYDPEILEQLEALSDSTGRTVTSIVNEALGQYLGQQAEVDLPERVAALEARMAAIESRLGISP